MSEEEPPIYDTQEQVSTVEESKTDMQAYEEEINEKVAQAVASQPKKITNKKLMVLRVRQLQQELKIAVTKHDVLKTMDKESLEKMIADLEGGVVEEQKTNVSEVIQNTQIKQQINEQSKAMGIETLHGIDILASFGTELVAKKFEDQLGQNVDGYTKLTCQSKEELTPFYGAIYDKHAPKIDQYGDNPIAMLAMAKMGLLYNVYEQKKAEASEIVSEEH